MGLSVTLSNALSGMKIGQNALDVLSGNVANAGTPGYHKRSISVIDSLGANSTYARQGALTRTFNQSLSSITPAPYRTPRSPRFVRPIWIVCRPCSACPAPPARWIAPSPNSRPL